MTLAALRALATQAGPPASAEAAPHEPPLPAVLTLASPDFPAALRELRSPPPMLWCRGAPELLARPIIAIAGPRKASVGALSWAERIATEAAAMGAVIMTGRAEGVDRAAEAAARRAGGDTIAVLAEGILAAMRADDEPRGLVLSEFRPDAPWRPGQAMQRNTTICRLALGLFVVEPGERGGTLHAARTALRLGRPVHVVAAPEDQVTAKALAADGAHLLTSGAAIAEALGALQPGSGPQIRA